MGSVALRTRRLCGAVAVAGRRLGIAGHVAESRERADGSKASSVEFVFLKTKKGIAFYKQEGLMNLGSKFDIIAELPF